MEIDNSLKNIINSFLPKGIIQSIKPINNGLINATFFVQLYQENQAKNYILQKINTSIFRHPKAIHTNISVVSNHLKSKNYPHPVLELCPTNDGNNEAEINGETWRMFIQIENSYSINVVESATQAYAVGAFFGQFYNFLDGIDLNQIQTVLPHFLDTNSRVDAFLNALKSASIERLTIAQQQIEWMKNNQDLPEKWKQLQQQNSLPVRLIHADPKISNVLFDKTTKQPKAIIDWDTLMLGTILYDYGDMIRSYTNTKLEDDSNPKDIFNVEVYNALTDGFLSATHTFLTDIEKEYLNYAPQVIIYIQGLRFLTDYLKGDVYYHCNYPEQNLNRAKNQIHLLQQILNLKK